MQNWHDNSVDKTVNKTVDFLADFDEVKAIVAVPDGIYIVRVTNWNVEHNHNGTPTVTISYEIQLGEYSGQTVYSNLYWTDRAKRQSKTTLDLLKIDPRKSIEADCQLYAEVESVKKGGSNFPEITVIRRLSQDEVNQRIVPKKDSGNGIPGLM